MPARHPHHDARGGVGGGDHGHDDDWHGGGAALDSRYRQGLHPPLCLVFALHLLLAPGDAPDDVGGALAPVDAHA